MGSRAACGRCCGSELPSLWSRLPRWCLRCAPSASRGGKSSVSALSSRIFFSKGLSFVRRAPTPVFLGASWKARPRLAPALSVRDKYVTKVQVNINIHIFKGKLYRKKSQVLDCFLLCPFDHNCHSHTCNVSIIQRVEVHGGGGGGGGHPLGDGQRDHGNTAAVLTLTFA